ncbi:hypothetical protein C3Y87_02945 [Carbonactinospora thermoautotrophica]|uniref:S8 family serine peptidase n=1 Tax=Carbonactinospora thermoautotrophica TaxID=1469144 RepID=UPI00227167E8|nr:S8 family serine peptidase [Carbonactinospora thermoautotrophica]MCX9190389.1 hypothetical protein [Carbonactinospora thermoautotrophica]
MPVKKTLLGAVSAGVCLALTVAIPAVADQRDDRGKPAKVSSWLHRKPLAGQRSAPAPSRTTVVVRYKPGTSPSRRSAVAQRYGKRVAAARTRLQLDVLHVADARAAVRELRRDPNVLWAEPLTYVVAYGVEQREIASAMDVAAAEWTGDPRLRGSGQIVGVIDTGVDPSNPDLAGVDRVRDGGAFDSQGNYSPGGTVPSHWHGTAVAALIAGDDDGDGVTGSAPEARVRAYRVLDEDGGGTSLAVAAAIIKAAQDAAQDAATEGAPVQTVVNLSLGSPYASFAIRDALAEARRLAPWLLFVAAAGNDGALRPSYPAGHRGVLSVGALEPAGTSGWAVAPWSNGAEVDLVAPGAVRSWNGGYVDTVQGTSFASPLVAGLAADLYARLGTPRGASAADAVAAALKSGGREIAAPGGRYAVAVGSGRASGLESLRRITGTAPFATLFVDNGSVMGYEDGTHAVRAVVVTPGAAQGATVNLSATVGSFAASTTAVDEATPFGVVKAVDSRYVPPSSGADYTTVQQLTASPVGTGANPKSDSIPVVFDPKNAGGDAHPGKTATTYSFDSATWGYESWGIGVNLPAGAQVRYTIDYPGPKAAPLFVWAPEKTDGSPTVYDEPWLVDTAGATNDGTRTFTAPRSGRYIFGYVPFYETPENWSTPEPEGSWGVYKLTVDTPVASITVPSIATAVSTTTAVPIRWSAPGSGNKYNVEYTYPMRNSNGTWSYAAWKRWQNGTAATSATFTGSQGNTYYFRVQAIDTKGNVGPWTGMYPTVTPYDDRSTALKYYGTWTNVAPSSRYYTTVKRSSAAGAYFTLQQYATRFHVVGDRCASCGQIKIYVDGRYLATVDTYSSSTKVRQTLYTTPALSPARGTHTLKVVVVGTRGRPYLLLDAVGVQR